MGRAGCYRVLLGVESADHDVRNRNGKAMAQTVASHAASSQPGVPLLTQQSLVGAIGQPPQNTEIFESYAVFVHVSAVIVLPVPITEYHTPGAELEVPQVPTLSNVADVVEPFADPEPPDGTAMGSAPSHASFSGVIPP